MLLIFKERSIGDVEQEVTQRDQFYTDEVALIATLMREPHQNSLDAKSRIVTGPVKTRLTIVEPSASNRLYFQRLFEKIEPHLRASDVDISGLDLGMPRLLLIEDFGTTGLVGQYNDPDDEKPFNDFWRRLGRSHKSGTSGGRWGLGKLVYSSASQVRTFFGLTVREDDPNRQPLLMGQTVLATHRIGGKKYQPYGFYGVERSDGFQLPVTNPAEIEEFIKSTGVTRGNEPGLSIVIPFVLDDLTPAVMIPELLRNYFFPILTGHLEIQVHGEVINASTFDSIAKRYTGNESFSEGHLINFIRRIHSASGAKPDAVLSDKWPISIENAFGEELLGQLRKKFILEGDVVHVRVPISLSRKGAGNERTEFDLFLQKSPDNIKSDALFVRSSITVPDESRYFRARQTFGALLARDPVITSFLGDAENPAHTRWNGAAEKLTKSWRAGKTRLSEIRNSLNRLYQALAQAVEVREPDALKDYFSIPDATVTSGPKPPPPVPPMPPILKKPALFAIAERRGGFAIKAGPGLTADKLPLQITIRTAYDVFRGNPFKRFNALDFDFKDLVIEQNGVTSTRTAPNELLLDVATSEFEFEVDGFDINRDLIVDARKS